MDFENRSKFEFSETRSEASGDSGVVRVDVKVVPIGPL